VSAVETCKGAGPSLPQASFTLRELHRSLGCADSSGLALDRLSDLLAATKPTCAKAGFGGDRASSPATDPAPDKVSLARTAPLLALPASCAITNFCKPLVSARRWS
jgi:hypothetical protein